MAKPLLVICAVLAVLWAASPVAASATGAVHCKGVTVASRVLQVGGVLSDPESFKGTLRVKATREGRKPYFLVNGDLVSAASAKDTIPAGRVAIANLAEKLPYDPKKEKGRWRSVPVTVSGVRFAGRYHGRLELGSGGCRVRLIVIAASAGAEISLVGTGEEKAVKLKLARCRYHTCAPFHLTMGINPPSSRQNTLRVQVENSSQEDAVVKEVQVALNGDVGEAIVPKGAFTPEEQKFSLPAQRATTLEPIRISRGQIEPGHYTGAIYLRLEGAEKRVVLPFEIDVKDGPFWALVVLLAAVFAQAMIAFAKRVKPRGAVATEVEKTREKAREKLGTGDSKLLSERLDQARRDALDGKFDEVKASLTKIEADIECVASARQLEAQASSKGVALPAEAKQAAKDLRAEVEKGGAGANSKLTDLRASITHAITEKAEQGHDATFSPEEAMMADAEVGSRRRGGERGSLRQRASRLLAWSGIYILPWLIQGLLVVVFLFAGLEKLYASNATFGAQDVLDYGGVFLWGLSGAALNILLGKLDLPGS